MTYLAKLWTTNLRYRWSNWRHRASPNTTSVRADLKPANPEELKAVAEELYRNFEYTPDGLLRLFDSIDAPAGSWERAFNPGPLKDDCDGFHGALYWSAHKQMFCYLLTLVTANVIDSHTLLCVEHEGRHYFVDYTHCSSGFISFDSMVNAIISHRRMGKVILTEGSTWNGVGWESLFNLEGNYGG